MNTNELEKNRLLTKKDFNIFFLPHELHEFKKMSINKLRLTYGVTHSIKGKYSLNNPIKNKISKLIFTKNAIKRYK